MQKLDLLLDFLEDHADEEHAQRRGQLHLVAMAYGPVPRLPLTLGYPTEEQSGRSRI